MNAWREIAGLQFIAISIDLGLLIAVGLFTRWHAPGLAATMFIAWLLWHERRFTGKNPSSRLARIDAAPRRERCAVASASMFRTRRWLVITHVLSRV